MPPSLKFLTALMLASIAFLSAAAETNGAAGSFIIGHDIEAEIDPDTGTLRADDRLTLPADQQQFVFWLHQGLRPKVTGGDARLERIGRNDHLERFRLTPVSDAPITLSYGGRIRHPMQSITEGMGRSRMQSLGTIERDGVFLSGYTGWYPNILGALLHFELAVTLPPNWLAVSQGAGPAISDKGETVRIGWRESQPQDEIQLSAARFKLYRKETPYGEAQAYLRRPDDALASRYLDATARYLARYSKLIGAYPYAKFALVENFWETGYGMPSFTLLGSQVLRLPFILHSSYPHEILHNWWGNGVFVDYQAGNWSEGLTAYLADHLNQELAARGADYRRDQLKAYADYVRDGEDFPLTAFRGRHGSASQAIGYGKMLMFAHMLRIKLGDDDFRRGLRRFYVDNRFRGADFDDLRIAFEQASNRDLQAFFDAWTERTGAPELKLGNIDVEQARSGGYRVSGSLYQTQADPAFPMVVPVVIHADRGRPREVLAQFNERGARFDTLVAGPPVRVAVDPGFDSFRSLMPSESPVTLSNLFGAEAGLIVVPAQAPEALRSGYLALAQHWQRGHPRWEIVADDTIDRPPDNLPIWLLGWDNRFLDILSTDLAIDGSAFAMDVDKRRVTLEGNEHTNLSVVITRRRGQQPIGFVSAAEPAALPGLARKLPHYGKYGYLLFSGSAPDNQLKGRWPIGDSELMRWFVDARPALQLPSRPPLVIE